MTRSSLEFHGLSEPPFSLTSDPRFLYESRAYTIALADVINAVERRQGLIVITGGPGIGKTLLCRALMQHLGSDTRLSAIPSPLVSGGELLSQIVGDFGLIFPSDLNESLAGLASSGTHAVVIIDEAQHLGKDALDEIGRLSNLVHEGAKLLQIILVGQPDLRTMMERDAPEVEQLVALRCVLRPLAPDEVDPYIRRRLEVARASSVAFSPDATAAIARISRGVPRTINLLGDRALALAAEREAQTIEASVVNSAAGQLQLARDEPETPKSTLLKPMMITAAALGVVAVLAWWWVSDSKMLSPGTVVDPVPVPAAAAPPASEPPPAPPVPAPVAPAPMIGTLPALESVVLSVGSYRSEEQANETVKRLEAKGLPVFIRAGTGRGVRVVLVGPYVSREEALETRKALEELRYRDAQVVVEPPSRR